MGMELFGESQKWKLQGLPVSMSADYGASWWVRQQHESNHNMLSRGLSCEANSPEYSMIIHASRYEKLGQ